MKKLNLIYTSLFLVGSISFSGVPPLVNLCSEVFIKAYDGSEEHREALRSMNSEIYNFSNQVIEKKNFSGESFEKANLETVN